MSYKIRLSTQQSYELADHMNAISNKKLLRRLLAISLRHYGYPVKEIAALTGVSTKTITNWMKIFVEKGFEGLLETHYPKRRDSILQPYEAVIRSFFESNPKGRVEDLQAYLLEKHDIKVEYSWLYRYITLHELKEGF